MDEPLLRTIAADIQAAIPAAEVRLFGSRTRGTARPNSDLDLRVTVPDAWRKPGCCFCCPSSLRSPLPSA
jgi:uncharacterized protein